MSTLTFNADKVFDIAKRIERTGAEFYRTAEPLMTGEDGKSLMRSLADMEVVHERIFAEMQSALANSETGGTPSDLQDEAYAFLKGMADAYVFSPDLSPWHVLKPGANVKKILDFAIERERDSVIFYEGIKVMVPENSGRARLEEIIEQEMGHIIILTKFLNKA